MSGSTQAKLGNKDTTHLKNQIKNETFKHGMFFRENCHYVCDLLYQLQQILYIFTG
jgi:hypothetical protein